MMIINFTGNFLGNIKSAATSSDLTPEEFVTEAISTMLTMSTLSAADYKVVCDIINRRNDEIVKEALFLNQTE